MTPLVDKEAWLLRGEARLGVKSKELGWFAEHDIFNDLPLEGVISRHPDHRYGALVTFRVGDSKRPGRRATGVQARVLVG